MNNNLNGVDNFNNNSKKTFMETKKSDVSINNLSSVEDEELLKAFIGKNYDKLTTSPFNLFGFLFGTTYMFYRRMNLYAIILFSFRFLVIILMPVQFKDIDEIFVILVFNTVVGFLMNKIYLFYAKRKIKKIKKRNQGKEFNELKGFCSAMGGTSVKGTVLGLLILFISVCIFCFVVLFIGFLPTLGGSEK